MPIEANFLIGKILHRLHPRNLSCFLVIMSRMMICRCIDHSIQIYPKGFLPCKCSCLHVHKDLAENKRGYLLCLIFFYQIMRWGLRYFSSWYGSLFPLFFMFCLWTKHQSLDMLSSLPSGGWESLILPSCNFQHIWPRPFKQDKPTANFH